jgi:hypothetical protein
MIEANIRADAAPAIRAISAKAIISCPAPFERLEASFAPTIGDRTTRKPYEFEKVTTGGPAAAGRIGRISE